MASAYFGPADYFVLENAGARGALFAFGSAEAAVHRVVVLARDGRAAEWSTKERNFCGRLEAGGLEPDSAFTARAYAGKREIAALSFSTLPQVPGSPVLRFAVVADPHVSVDRENRRGRMFQESSCVLQEIVDWAGLQGMDALLVPGDLSDAGKPEEMRRAAGILSAFPGRVFVAPGDHDQGGKRGGASPWPYPVPFLERWADMQVLGLDTSSGVLGDAQHRLLDRALGGPGRLIILSHHDLVLNPDIRDADAVIEDHEKIRGVLTGARKTWVAYCGHKNVPSLLRVGLGVQINAPQPTQYPAGILSVSVFERALVQQFVPIRSEILRSYSLRMLGCDESPSFEPAYRYGTFAGRCSVLPWDEG